MKERLRRVVAAIRARRDKARERVVAFAINFKTCLVRAILQ